MAFAIILLIELAIVGVGIAGLWKTFEKAGKPGWTAIIPIYNLIILLQIAGKPLWWIILFLIPGVNFVMGIILMLAVADAYGKSAGFGIGLLFLGFIFFPMLGFGDAVYKGSAAQPRGFTPVMPGQNT